MIIHAIFSRRGILEHLVVSSILIPTIQMINTFISLIMLFKNSQIIMETLRMEIKCLMINFKVTLTHKTINLM